MSHSEDPPEPFTKDPLPTDPVPLPRQRTNESLRLSPQPRLRSIIGLTGTIAIILVSCSTTFVATCGTTVTIGFATGQERGASAALPWGILLGILIAGLVGYCGYRLCNHLFGARSDRSDHDTM